MKTIMWFGWKQILLLFFASEILFFSPSQTVEPFDEGRVQEEEC